MKKLLLNNEEIELDDDSYELIKYMNEVGYVTLNSCSGTEKDHPEGLKKYNGYVNIANNDKAWRLLSLMNDNKFLVYYSIYHADDEFLNNASFYYKNKDNENTDKVINLIRNLEEDKNYNPQIFKELNNVIHLIKENIKYNIEIELNSESKKTRDYLQYKDDEEGIGVWINNIDKNLDEVNELTNRLVNSYGFIHITDDDQNRDCDRVVLGSSTWRTIAIKGNDLELLINVIKEIDNNY